MISRVLMMVDRMQMHLIHLVIANEVRYLQQRFAAMASFVIGVDDHQTILICAIQVSTNSSFDIIEIHHDD